MLAKPKSWNLLQAEPFNVASQQDEIHRKENNRHHGTGTKQCAHCLGEMLSHILKDENAVEQQHLNGDSRDEDEYHLADCPPWVVDKACC